MEICLTPFHSLVTYGRDASWFSHVGSQLSGFSLLLLLVMLQQPCASFILYFCQSVFWDRFLEVGFWAVTLFRGAS